MAVLLAALSAGVFGVSDFLGGMSAKRIAATLTSITAELSGLAGLLLVALVVGGAPTHRDWAWGAAAGLAGGLALSGFYWAMSRGPMSVVAPISALMSALVPLAAGLMLGERPPAIALAGALLALPAIVLISREASDRRSPDETPPSSDRQLNRLVLIVAAATGVGFGLFFVCLAQPAAASGMWPVAAARLTGAVVIGVALLLHRPQGSDRIGVQLALTAGLLDVTANVLFLLASRQGLLTLVGVVAAMYPASTVVLARLVLHERLARHQLAGLVLAVTAVAGIATG